MIYPMKTLLEDAYKNKYGIPAFNFENFDMLEGIFIGANEVKAPIILQTTEPAINYLGIENIVYMVNSYSEKYQVPVALHLDHADNMEIIKKCMDSGYTSVMIDASENNIEENIKITRQVVEYAKPYNVTVEAEIGIVDSVTGKNENEKNVKNNDEMTKTGDAKYFLEKTNVDVLGVSIGNIHGMRIKETKINYDRLIEIDKIIERPLVLHGSSGISDDNLKQLVKYGITKINIETELRLVFRNELTKYLEKNSTDIKPRNIMGYIKEKIKEAVVRKCIALGTINRVDELLKNINKE